MATINQLVKKGRKQKTRKSKSPVLNIGYNSFERKQTEIMPVLRCRTLQLKNKLDVIEIWNRRAAPKAHPRKKKQENAPK